MKNELKMKTKLCTKCDETKELKEFYRNKRSSDGLQINCKLCTKIYQEANKKRISEYQKIYQKFYRLTDKGKTVMRKKDKQYRAKHPERYIANVAVGNAIRDDKLFCQPCEICDSEHKIQAHHEDYSKPLEVNWLCKKHHDKLHEDLKQMCK